MSNILVKIVVCLLASKRLPVESRIVLTNAVLNKLAAIQSDDILKVTEQGIILEGQPVDYEKARLLQESARGALHSTARSIVRKQVEYLAVTHGIHRAEQPEQMLFAKAAIWWGQEEEKLLTLLAGEEPAL